MGRHQPLHLIIIDSWNPAVVERELAAGRLPALEFLLRHGRLNSGCASIFPTVTPACLTSLATGAGPDQHGVTGVLWYNRRSDRYVHYWPYPQSLYWGTIDHVIEDFFLKLNAEHLSPEVKTIFELLEEADVPSACINFPVSRGPHLHRAELPWLLRRLSGLPRDLAMPGPRLMRHGDMIRAGHQRRHLFRKYGFTDHQSAVFSAEVVRNHRPAFMLTYFNENDLRSHHKGPERTGPSLRRVDAELGLMMDAYGSWERAVEEARWLITGDHSQSNTFPARPGFAVNVYKAFPGLSVTPLRTGGLKASGHDFAVSPNDRMCYVYLAEGREHRLDDVIELASRWPSVDQIFWRDGSWLHAFRPMTGDSLSWRPGGPFVDPNGRTWDIEGALGAVDATLVGNRLRYGDYPNALERVTQALSVPGGGELILTARLGYEFTSGFPMGRGNHGSLHRLDSEVPLVTVGLPAIENARTTDLVPAILDAFGVPHPEAMRRAAPQ